MGTPYLGELRLIAWNYAPKGWTFANGQTVPINQNQALFALFGTMYGGNGQTTFQLPNLQGRVPIHFGSGFTQGQAGGESSHTLTVPEMPAHTHLMNAVNGPANTTSLSGTMLAQGGSNNIYHPGSGTPMLPANVSNTGGSQPHNNLQPYLVLNWIVALQGIFPSRN